MALSIGIVGLPNVGKSTLFNALTKKSVPAENYPFCTIDPSVGIVSVEDSRLYKLSEFSKSRKTIPAIVEFVDIAGLVKGASEGEGLGNQFLSHIRETDAILQIVRIFEDSKVIHVGGKIDPKFDIEIINFELLASDKNTLEKRKSNLAKDIKKGDKDAVFEDKIIEKALNIVNENKLLSTCDFDEKELKVLKSLNLLTIKPILFGLNKKAGGQNLDEIKDQRWTDLLNFLDTNSYKWTIIDAKIENDLKDLEGEEKEMFRKELGGQDDGISNLIHKSYELLGLITYFTTGEDETRGWTVKKGSSAPVASMAIHTDFKDKFIKAEVIEWDKLLEAGSFANARERGLIRTEGKEYIVKDGDVVEFRI
jgi:GTP-binding protein YchF